jgi:hypothetical protein
MVAGLAASNQARIKQGHALMPEKRSTLLHVPSLKLFSLGGFSKCTNGSLKNIDVSSLSFRSNQLVFSKI